VNDQDCTFCAIVRGDGPAHIVAEDEETLAFLDINPVTRGHTLVIPREHVVDMWDADEETAAAVMRGAARVAAMVRRTLDPPGLNLFQATRALAGQTVFHLHIHVLPRYDAGELRIGLSATRGTEEDLAAVAADIRGET
jgi:histidine triad (HIT) family protein